MLVVESDRASASPNERPSVPFGFEPRAVEVLVARREVIRARRRQRRLAQRLEKPVYMNTNAYCSDDRAVLAYVSTTIGNRTELIRCQDNVHAEYLALLMAMQDVRQVISGPVVFRVDCPAITRLTSGKGTRLEDVRDQIKIMLDGNPYWIVELVERKRNRPATALATRVFKQLETRK